MRTISRRRFLASVAAGTAGMYFGTAGRNAPAQTRQPNEEPRIRRYTRLGDTGITISDVIFGAGAVYERDVVRYAYDRGVTGFDTAAQYTGGISEAHIGQGLEGVRDKCCIITKQGFSRRRPAEKKAIARILEDSLRNLRSDYVDGLFVHSMESMDALRNDEVAESFARFKKEGKVRFTGFSTHNERATLTECIKSRYDGVVDAVMFRYNHMEGESIKPLIAALHKKGIGTIAMKTLAGGRRDKLGELCDERTSYEQAAIAWVLSNGNVDCAVTSMDNYSLVDNYVGASGRELDRSGRSLLRRYRDAVDETYCRVTCTACEAACPHHVAISDVMRCEMYFRDYGHVRKAIAQYADLDPARKPAACRQCAGHCGLACPYGLEVRDRLLRTHRLLTV